MTRTIVALTLSMLVVPQADAGLSQTDATTGKPRIELFWSDYKLLVNKLPAGAREAIEREAVSIFAEAGIDLSFFVGSPEDLGKRDAHAIRIVLMPRSAEGWTLPSEAMGAILERNARAGTVYVFVPVVERAIGIAVEGNEMLHDARKAYALARALGRVLAHEPFMPSTPTSPMVPKEAS